jgi:hypothetical protein
MDEKAWKVVNDVLVVDSPSMVVDDGGRDRVNVIEENPVLLNEEHADSIEVRSRRGIRGEGSRARYRLTR